MILRRLDPVLLRVLRLNWRTFGARILVLKDVGISPSGNRGFSLFKVEEFLLLLNYGSSFLLKFKCLLRLIKRLAVIALRGLRPAVLSSIQCRVELLLAAHVTEALCCLVVTIVELAHEQVVMFSWLRLLLVLVLQEAGQRVASPAIVRVI